MEMAITNEMLYNFLKEFKADFVEFKGDVNKRFERVDKRFEGIDKRFEQVDKRFEQVDKRFEQVDKRFDEVISLIKEERVERIDADRRLEDKIDSAKGKLETRIDSAEGKLETRMDSIEGKLDKIYECRDRVAVKFTRTWMFASFFIAILASMITLAFDKAF